MIINYTIHAARKNVGNKIPCNSATMALAESKRLKKQGWQVTIYNSLGIKMTELGLDRLRRAEAGSVGLPDKLT